MSIERFNPLPLPQDPIKAGRVLRLNSLGSLFYFTRVTLKRKRLSEGLHLPFCQSLERPHIKDVIEMPRDHFKSTVCGEGLPMWRSLPVSNQDIDEIKALGYSDEFVRWITQIHNPDLRNLLVSENITNAAKLGRKIRWHYESNGLYRELFPETLPDTSCVWTDYSLHVKRPKTTTGGAHGEGTFDFLGVGSALQSRHYNGLCVQDDLVGRKAIESQTIMEKTIEYHQLLVNATESEDKLHECDELVVGNRWSYSDLNSHLREHEAISPENPRGFRFESHSALGGCCNLHPLDQPIFPEEFSIYKLMDRKKRLGAYNFSCQFLNNPSAPDNADFNIAWLNYFELAQDSNLDWFVKHEVKDGYVRSDIKRQHLSLAMTIDPNHSGNAAAGRCRHAIIVLGVSEDSNYYLLDSWAQAASYDTFYQKVFQLAQKWHLTKVGLETIAAQRYIGHHILHLSKTSSWPLKIIELKGEVEAPDGTMSRKKEWRIRNVIAPIAEQGRLFVQRKHQDFITEYQTFPQGKFCDQLDAFAYAPQLVKAPMNWAQHIELLAANQKAMNKVGQPYSMGVA